MRRNAKLDHHVGESHHGEAHQTVRLGARHGPRKCPRKGFLRLLYVAAVMFSIVPGKPARATVEHKLSHGSAPSLRISPEGWGETSLDDLKLVLDAVAAELAPRFPQRQLGTLRVVYGEGGPMAFYDKSADGDYVIRLSARHSRWHQFVYQFSHELCHLYSNFDNKHARHGEIGHSNQWFEESVCEAAALYTVRRLAERWETEPPAPQFAGYGATLRALADYLLNEPHRHLSSSTSLASWFRSNQSELEESPYLRDKNEVVANRMLPLFEQNPEAVGAIGYLNHDPEDAGRNFEDYLRAWKEACPPTQRGVVQQVIALFGADASGQTETATPAVPSGLLLARNTR